MKKILESELDQNNETYVTRGIKQPTRTRVGAIEKILQLATFRARIACTF